MPLRGGKVHEIGLADNHYSLTDIHDDADTVVHDIDSLQEVHALLRLIEPPHSRLIHVETLRSYLAEVS